MQKSRQIHQTFVWQNKIGWLWNEWKIGKSLILPAITSIKTTNSINIDPMCPKDTFNGCNYNDHHNNNSHQIKCSINAGLWVMLWGPFSLNFQLTAYCYTTTSTPLLKIFNIRTTFRSWGVYVTECELLTHCFVL